MPAERTAQTYGPGVTAASRAVLLETMTVLRSYQDALVLVGGWAPYLLLQQHQRPEDQFVHVGSIDIDLAVDPSQVSDAQYATMLQLLAERGYRPLADRRDGGPPCSVERTVNSPLTQKPYPIRVDFLTRLQDPRPGRHRHLPVQDDLLARKIKGCDAAFRYQMTIQFSGELPDGGRLTVPMRMASLVACLTMKGIVLGERYREKDAYDIYALLAHYQGGPRDAAEMLRPHLDDPLVAEGMANIRAAFATRDAHGPAWVAAFLVNPMFAAAYQRHRTDAFMTVGEFSKWLWSTQPSVR